MTQQSGGTTYGCSPNKYCDEWDQWRCPMTCKSTPATLAGNQAQVVWCFGPTQVARITLVTSRASVGPALESHGASLRNTALSSCHGLPRVGHIARRALANLHNLLRSDTSTEASAWKVPNGHIRALAGPDATAMPGPATLNSSTPSGILSSNGSFAPGPRLQGSCQSQPPVLV